ncbi:DNA polymerase III subunit epsilon [Legionella beliardensis]|uniref:DNA polymerase III subunit epsilon n=1 Tax=Legionella beliardensis TaxID=91822 RepID=A0A378I2T0_9GAMM|nr:DNA polymerase III subunit epsilon [Legionella beliardensis]STX28976.1 DNA polymerase III subunit epsilon [Legionella beliardensis]
MRQIVLDTETTGIDPQNGHRIIEIGCVELIDRKLTGNNYHAYLNPEREVDEGAFKVHGISTEFLADKPRFCEVVEELLEFIKDAELIIHNAAFDIGFLNAELTLLNWPHQVHNYCKVLDTLLLAREKHPGQRNSLDALCKRYEIDNSNRELHGALLDAEILALVYLAMTGGQGSLFEDNLEQVDSTIITTTVSQATLQSTSPIIYATEQELASHQEFVQFLVKKSGTNHWEEESN